MKHQQIDRRSIAFGGVIVARLKQNPELLSIARASLSRWIASGSPRTRAAWEEWQRIVDQGLGAVSSVLTADDEESTRLRQSSPFAGERFITRRERAAILQRFDEKRRWKGRPGNRYAPAELKRIAELDLVMERPPVRPAIEV